MCYHLESHRASPWQMRALDISSCNVVLQVLAFAMGIRGLGCSRGCSRGGGCLHSVVLQRLLWIRPRLGQGRGAGLPPAGLLWPSF